jgi:hypothetical protein
VDWSSSAQPIQIVVTVNHRGVVRRVEGSYIPQQGPSYYKRLITSYGPVGVLAIDGSNYDHRNTAILNGGPNGFWQNDPDSTWTTLVKAYTPTQPIRFGSVPLPETQSFIDSLFPTAQIPASYFDGANQVYDASPEGYYTWNVPGTDFTLERATGARLRVRNTAVWLFPKGIHISNAVSVESVSAPSPACLVIVAEPNLTHVDEPTAGIWFQGGLNSTIPVILVSRGRVLVEQIQNLTNSTEASSLSIYAGSVFIGGPQNLPTQEEARLSYSPAMSDALIDSLSTHGALPNATAATRGTFTLVRGSWRDTLP